MAQRILETKLPNGLTNKKIKTVPVELIPVAQFPAWRKKQKKSANQWLDSIKFQPKPGSYTIFSSINGTIERVALCYDALNIWTLAAMPMVLPEGVYAIEDADKIDRDLLRDIALGWSLGSYQFSRYKKTARNPAQLAAPKNIDADYILHASQAIYLIRDMVNTPAEDMGPDHMADIARNIAKQHGAKIRVIAGDDLLDENYPMVHAVGRAGPKPPCVIDMRWGNPRHKKLTLVGKGVAFDTGGLDIKGDANMLIMKKDMGGAAHAIALGHWIMAARLPVSLRVIVPAVENSVDSNSFRPLDILKSRKGISVEIGNTDAEGRLILGDCLWDASGEKPDLLIDFATLTGAARVALGPDLPALFASRDATADALQKLSVQRNDPLWRLPLWKNYRPWLDSKIADINNTPANGMAGAVTAALFLQEFVMPELDWMHFDLYAWNQADRPGRPQGGEAMTIRALFSLLQDRFGRDN